MHRTGIITKIEKDNESTRILASQVITPACINCHTKCARQGKPFEVLNRQNLEIKVGSLVHIKPSPIHYYAGGILSLLAPIASAIGGFFAAPAIAARLGLPFTQYFHAGTTMIFFLFMSLVVFLVSRSPLTFSKPEIVEIL